MWTNTIQFILCVVSGTFTLAAVWFGVKLNREECEREKNEQHRQEAAKKSKEETDAIREGMQALLRDRIIQVYNSCEEKEGSTFFEVENMTHMYNAYSGLGGNGAITALFKKFQKLPYNHCDKECDEN
jgi:hypothetical protein